MSATITIARGAGYADWFRAYHVMLDGEEIGRIGNGETKSFAITPGQHRLALKIDWCGSNELSFSTAVDNLLTFQCDCACRGLRLLTGFYYVFWAKNRYLWLKRADM